MSFRPLFFLSLAAAVAVFAGADDENKLTKLAKAPDGISPAIATTLNPQGFRVESGDGAVCDIWVEKGLTIQPGFKPTSNVKYPFRSGQLIGVLRVGDKVEFSDFRGQPLKPGAYTLRYAQQPQDGNHIGTSELSDFLLAIPANDDADSQAIGPVQKLHKASAKATGGNHPAIFSLLPSESPPKAATLSKIENDRWVLSIPATGVQNGKKVPLALRFIIIGKAEG